MILSEPEAKVGGETSWRPPAFASQPSEGPSDPSKNDIEQIRKRAYDEAYTEGLAAGRAQGEGIAAEMGALLQAMAKPFEDADAALVRELVALVERVVSAVLDRELDAGAYDLERTLGEALKVLGAVSVPVELRLHPSDVALCRDLGLPAEPELNVVEDASLARGGLRLKAGARLVDASMEARLAEVLTALRVEAGLPDPATDSSAPVLQESEGSGA